MKQIKLVIMLFFFSMIVTAQNVDLQKGLVGYWSFNGNANDESGNGNHGKVKGALLTYGQDGSPNKSYKFSDGTYIEVTNSNSLKFYNQISFTAWVNLNSKYGRDGNGNLSNNGYHVIFSKNCDRDWIQAGIGSDFRFDFGSWKGGHSAVMKDFKLNSWEFVTAVYDGAKIYLYHNAVLIGQKEIKIDFNPSNSQNLIIGKSGCFSYYFNGSIAAIRIYNRALNMSEIQVLYTKTEKNPKLEISNLILENSKGNNSIGTYQSANLKFNIANNGKADAKNVEIKISETNYINGLDFPYSKTVGDINIGSQQEITIPVKALKDLTDGTANFSIQLTEKNGFNSSKKTLNIATKAVKSLTEEIKMYVESKVNEWQQKGEFEKSSDYRIRVNENTRTKKIEEFQAIAVNEFKKQYAESINFKNLKLGTYDADNECFLLSSSQLSEFVVPVPLADAPAFKQNFSSMKFQSSDFYIKDDNFVLSHLEIVGANNKKYIFDSKNKTTYALTKIDYKFAEIEVDVEDKSATNNNKIQKSANTISVGKSDVDINIPICTEIKTNTYALIIGNEDYSSFQTGLNTEVNVDFAMNDAKIFKEYCNKTLGIPEKQIKLMVNATSGQMNQGISWLNNLAKIDNGNAELIFYYSGHGLPDEQTKESYLMPVDISGSNVTQAIKLTDIYNKLNEYPAKKVTVFLDACFSGGARNQGLITMKGVKIKPKENMITGNMIVLSSSSGDESSGVYRDKQHGFMTYFLLKKIQESKGNISYKELADYIIENVKKETALIGKNQTPQLNYSLNLEGTWTNWRVK